MKKDFAELLDNVQLIPLSKGYRLNDFICKIKEYSDYLQTDALNYQESRISHAHLLINKQNADVIAYMVLVTDSIKLSDNEKEEHKINNIPFGAFPSLKIGKLAVHKDYQEQYRGIGSTMIKMAIGTAYEINNIGVACKFLTIDADIEHDKDVIEFYTKNGFKFNEKYNNKNRTQTVSMRLDIFHDVVEQYKQTGTEN